ncbi:MAG TPA: hypothetical protein VHX38_03705 [Pseudonocardiaceae bacterium]|jgi:hypothetical protein|nr:hypothetical protein [Pseudonocardiaceae bacterium]
MTGTGPAGLVPWPTPWPKPKPVGGLLWAAFFAVVALACLAIAVSMFLARPVDPIAFVVLTTVPVLCGLSLTSVALRTRIRARNTASVCVRTPALSQEPALRVPFQLPLVFAFWLTLVGVLPALLLLAAVGLLAAFDQQPIDIGALIIGLVLLALCIPSLGLVVDWLRGRTVRGELLLSPQDITYRTLAYDARIGWDAVRGVAPVDGDGQRIVITGDKPIELRRRSWLQRPSKAVLARASGTPLLVVRGISLAIDPALTFHVLRFYYDNPGARVELATDAAVQRIQNSAVVRG